MENKHLIGTEEGDAIAAFVSRIEEKTGKTLSSVHVRIIVDEKSIEKNVSLAFHQDRSPPNRTT